MFSRNRRWLVVAMLAATATVLFSSAHAQAQNRCCCSGGSMARPQGMSMPNGMQSQYNMMALAALQQRQNYMNALMQQQVQRNALLVAQQQNAQRNAVLQQQNAQLRSGQKK